MNRVVAAILLAGCAAPKPPSSQASPASITAEEWVRSITPFEVQGFYQPFLGGFDVPRPQFVDIDGDGDFDLFVQERSNALMYFENVGTAAVPKYVWRTDKYQELDIGEWSRFVDIDFDGDFDVMAETPFSYIRLYRNQGSNQQPRYALAADTIRDQDGKPIFADRQNIPQFVDLDCDRLMDLFIGKIEGTVTHYEEIAGTRAAGAPRFQFDMDRWEGIEIVNQMGPGELPPSLHGANTMFFADHDGDNDLDLFWGDYFEEGVLLIQNTGSCGTPSLRSVPTPLMHGAVKLATSGYNAPILVDIDADRDLDLFVGVIGGAYNPNRTAADNFYFLRRSASGFTIETTRFLSTIDVGSESIPALADLDADGDLDLVLTSKLDPGNAEPTSKLSIFRNTGSRQQPRFVLSDTLTLVTAYHYAPAFGDLDGDRDLDLVLGTWNQGVHFYRNDGKWVHEDAATLQLTRGSMATPSLGDLDGDGDLDLLIGEQSGEVNFYRNTGSARAHRFELVSDVFQQIDPGRRSHPLLTDYDNDRDLDLLMGMEEGSIALYRNQGTKQEPRFMLDASVRIPTPPNSTPAIGDLNGDGRPELLTGLNSGGLLYFSRK